MLPDWLVPWISRVVALSERYYALYDAAKRTHPTFDVAVYLSAFSGDFWFLSRFLGYLVLQIHDAMDESLGALLAVAYNIVLGVAFSAVLVLGIFREKGGSPYFYHYEAAGFAFAYVVLGATYAERSGEISEYAILGYAAGLIAYLAFCVHGSLVGGAWAMSLYSTVSWVVHGWVGKVTAALSVIQAGVFAWHAISRRARGSSWVFPRRVFF